MLARGEAERLAEPLVARSATHEEEKPLFDRDGREVSSYVRENRRDHVMEVAMLTLAAEAFAK